MSYLMYFLKNILLVVLLHAASSKAQQFCRTPDDSKPGLCIPFNQCNWVVKLSQYYKNQIPEVYRQYMIKSRCNFGAQSIHICCQMSQILQVKTRFEMNTQGLALLDQQTCGRVLDDKVAFGNKTAVEEFPWMALLRYADSKKPFQCGGSLITDRHILTAAHCVKNKTVIGVRLGEHDISSERDCMKTGRFKYCAQPVENFGIAKIVHHPEYYSSTLSNDVAIITLDRPVKFKDHIQPVCLPISTSSQQLPMKLTIAGWGTTEKGYTSSILLKAILDRQDLNECRRVFDGYKNYINDNHLCAGGNTLSDACDGDSGGPLFAPVSYKDRTRHVQYAVVSFGVAKCGSEQPYPAVYTSVIQHLPFITSNIV